MNTNFNEFGVSPPPGEPRVKKGDLVLVNLSYLEGKPDSTVDAQSDSFYSDHAKCECFDC